MPMSAPAKGKSSLACNVYVAARERMHFVFQHFPHVCVAFSGGKDSAVTLHLALDVARELGRLPVHALFIDLEGQYQTTIAYLEEVFSSSEVHPWWVALPLNLRNASSAEQPYWCAWDPEDRENWVRPYPTHAAVIKDPEFFPFYRHRMEFEEFVPAFNQWFAKQMGAPCAFLVGIRADESLNRYLSVRRPKKKAWTPPNGKPLPWSSREKGGGVSFFPIYDWRFSDIWHYISVTRMPYNRLYDLMYLAKVPFSYMRICQPYGDDQRRGLDLFQKLEPQTWARIANRVKGASYAARYCRQRLLGYRGGYGLPASFPSWQQYCIFLLQILPDALRIVYLRRIQRFMDWWEPRGYPLASWPDAGDTLLEARKLQPSWRRIALSLLKLDLARSLSFGVANGDKSLLIDCENFREKKSPMHHE